MYNKLLSIIPIILGYVWMFTLVVGSFTLAIWVCTMFLKLMGV